LSRAREVMKILWLKNNLLHPLDSGGKIRTYQLLRKIRDTHEVHFVAFAEPQRDRAAIDAASAYCHRIFTVEPPRIPSKNSLGYYLRVVSTIFDKHPFTVSSYQSLSMRNLIEELVRENAYDLLVVDFLSMCLNVPQQLTIPGVHFSHNVEAMIWRRLVENETNPVKRFVFDRERQRIERFEREVVNSCAFTITVSQKDSELFRNRYGATRVGYVGTGVDTEFFAPYGATVEPSSIIFLGSMDWMPNVDAVHYFVESIYPLIKVEVPEAMLSIVGRNPQASVKALARRDPSVLVSGTVPDTRAYIGKAAVAVVPMRIGSGTRIKIYEMMAMGKLVVSSSIGAEGLLYKDGETIVIADEPEEFARLTVRALRQDHWRDSIGANARAFVKARCSWQAVAKQFLDLLSHVEGR
jgi:sugar transferase (PEP-CTERM/EpsH1 system associated)